MPTEDTNKSPTSAPRLVTLKGVLIATALPMSWLVLFYSLAVHLRLALGRWPKSIGDNPHDWLFNIHYESTLLVGSLMWLSLIALPLIVIVGDRDEYVPLGPLREILDGIEGSELVVIEDVDHFFMNGLAGIGEAARGWLNPRS